MGETDPLTVLRAVVDRLVRSEFTDWALVELAGRGITAYARLQRAEQTRVTPRTFDLPDPVLAVAELGEHLAGAWADHCSGTIDLTDLERAVASAVALLEELGRFSAEV